MELQYLQAYWWLLISVLGAVLVFMLFVQGGQTMLLSQKDSLRRSLMINSLGRKWELTFTTLVVFGGAFFASFPLFYSTSFGGAYVLWMLILFSFVIQAVSYEYRRKPGNLYGSSTYDVFLFVNGCLGTILLGVAVAMMFFGAEFTVNKVNILDSASPVISRWAPTRGLEAIVCWKNLVLGFAVLFLARTQASLYFLNNISEDASLSDRNRRSVLVNGVIFVVFFLIFVALLLTAGGYRAVEGGKGAMALNTFVYEPNIYLHNFLSMWWASAAFLIGTLMVVYAIIIGAFRKRNISGIWWSGIGTVLVVLSLFWVAGYGNTAYYPSLLDYQSSLTIANSSSTLFTLKTMTWVSILIVPVIAYIVCVWYKMDRAPLTPTEIEGPGHKY